MSYRRFFLVAIFILAPLTARAADVNQLQAELDALRQRIDQQDQTIDAQHRELETLRSELGDTWLNQRRQEQVRQLVHEVLADADTRASLLDDGLTAGWNNGFYLASADGSFLLQVMGQIQVRHVLSTSDDAFNGATGKDLDNDVSGFEIHRTRVGFKGHVVDPNWQYFIWTGYSGSTGGGFLLDAYITRKFNDNWSVTFGQFKLPLWQEWLVSETRQQFVDRSLIHSMFSGSYTQGLRLDYRDERLHAAFSVNDGAGAFNAPWNVDGVEGVAVTGRVEWMALGDGWKKYADFESPRGEEPMLVLAAAAHWQQGNYGTSGTTLTTGDEAEILRWTADATLELGGANIFVAFLGNHLSEASGVDDLNQYGLIVQGGYFVTEKLELKARWEWGDLDIPGVEDLNVATVGFSYLFHGHQLKWTSDIGYAFNELNQVSIGGNDFGWQDTSHGWNPDAAGSDGQVVMRNQIQLLF